MGIESTLLFITACVNSLLSLFVLLGKKNKTNIVYSLFVLFASFWSIGLGFFIMEVDLNKALNIANFYYISAAGIPVFFLYFSILFLNKDDRLIKKRFFLTLPLFIITIILFLVKNFLIKEVFYTEWGKSVVINYRNYIIYGIYFVVFVIISYYNLIKSYFLKERTLEEKNQLRFIIIGTTIGFIFGMVFDLFLPIWNYRYIFIGPLFSFFMVFSIAYSITKHHLFDMKVVATEMLMFVLWLSILVRTILSNTLQEQIINGVTFLITVIVGIFLIKSVIKEVQLREKVEKLAKDLERANEGLALANERLKEVDKLKSEFLSLATHQIRAPLTSIKGYASLILEGDYGKVSAPIKGAVQTIYNSCQNLVVIVSEFLDISRIEQGRMKYDIVDFDINFEIKEIINEIKPTLEKTGLTMEFKSANNKNSVLADKGKMRQILSNILDNSIKYTPNGGINISVYEISNKIKIAVSDTGIGIAAEDIPKLFSKFTRAKDAFRTNVIGTGLGLYVAKQMIEAQNGKIWVESRGLGKGSTFYIELPKTK